ncbi:hypothetical protein DNC80_04095 [Flavobacterium sp. SOK18b]|uniref:DUF6646 family protein n=1 Tax=unclassified Flavobacterium TaxID=196869 RepID=UPI0015F91257|nr:MULTISPECIES: DUF6646 family protein [unclassified Flavobacterium]MBB1192847.1 hypothetical protein [Flavobacterium sp. SOK18b]QZK91691.1 hypothetical protein K5V07_14745 [Flavobacterium sp. CHNK8]
MKKIITLALLLTVGLSQAQAFKGAGDVKFDLGATIQNGGSGIRVATDFGLGENMSFGIASSYLLSVSNDALGSKPEFGDRIDVKGRFNANLGNVFELDPKMDIYPGLDLGLRNFGAHLGFRYFFTEGFGIFTEAGIPIASYKTNPIGFDKLNNQFTFNVGASFNL